MGAVLQAAVALLTLLVSTYVWLTVSAAARNRRLARQKGCLPAVRYPSWGPGIGLFRHLRAADNAGHRSQAYQNLHDRFGKTLEITVLGDVSIQTAHPENIQAVCTSNFDDWGVEPMRGRIGAPFMDRGIFMTDGDYWRYSRSLIRPIFSKAEIADLDNFERYVKSLLNIIPTDGESFDLLPLVKRLFLDTASEFIFGKTIDSLHPEKSAEGDEFLHAFDRSLLGLAFTLILGPLRWLVYIDPGWRKAYKKVHEFVDRRVQDVLQREKERRKGGHDSIAAAVGARSGDNDRDSRSKYILVDEIVKTTQDPYELRHQLINIFFPARDTAALAFGNIMHFLVRHPTWWEKLRDEVLPLGDTRLDYNLVRELKVVKAIVNEAIRLHPAASRLGRISLRDTVLPKGGGPDGESPLFVPKGRVIEMDVYCVQHSREYYGEDAEEFRPERWTEGRPRWEAKWQYEPFLGGVRMCPAQNMVLTQVSYLLVRFAQTFAKIECRDPVKEYVEQISMTVESRNGAKLALWRDRNAVSLQRPNPLPI